MEIRKLTELYAKHTKLKALLTTIEKKTVRRILLDNVPSSSMPMIFGSLHQKIKHNILYILSDADEAGYVYHDLCQIMPQQSVMFFPSAYKRATKYGQRDAANEILRTEVITTLTNSDKAHVHIVTHASAIAEMVVSQKIATDRQISISIGQCLEMEDVVKRLRELGFQQQDYIYEPGQFALRGSILDIYSFSSEYPFRIDFFGNEVDTIRTFDVVDQLSKEHRESIVIVPDLDKNCTEKQSFLSFLSDDTIIIAKNRKQVEDTITLVYEDGFSKQAIDERLATATEAEQKQIIQEMSKESQLLSPHTFCIDANRMKWVEYSSLQKGNYDATISFDIIPQPLLHKNFDLLRELINDYLAKGYRIFILAESLKQTQRLHDIIEASDGEETAKCLESITRTEYEDKSDNVPTKSGATLHEGFIDNDLRVCLLTDHQIFDRYHKYNLKSDKARKGKMALTMKELQEMEVGDYIVHIDFGIGKFMGLVRVPSGESYQEVIRLQYQRGDKVDVSIHSLYKISKYRNASNGEEPKLSILGSGAWERLKERTKKKIKDIARDLIRLYATRKKEPGISFSPDSYLQQELEASFLYEDTPDQLKATQEVKQDMEKASPMDRLVCGDVGFGKTEVAIRAAFKAACDSKQVAVLVPTTVLAFQHYNTFCSRLEGMPVRVEYLSRARSAKKTKMILDDLKDGKIDIIIGTHKLIGKSVKWHDLGLLIIDEEQKFGVATKEKLRQIKTNVDTLTMSATPIPRTLQFSLMGARDMSIIRTPPPNRHPITTELHSFGSEVICDAINFEMSRNGQVYFVNPRISNLIEIKLLIEKHIPDCRIAIGHGRMSPEELEKTLVDFMNHDYDVLLSTTIVENGIDISNANTIIINDAHKFGLSDLHQMRGRVGRSNRKAFCYLLTPPISLLNKDAQTRLEAMETFSDLGSGFALAMQDLDIRGAGNLLGAEQSGFLEDLGYETYQKILKQAMAELRNEEKVSAPIHEDKNLSDINVKVKDKVKVNNADSNEIEASEYVDDCSIDSDLEMYFPDSYVPGSAERMLLYRELDNIETEHDLEQYHKRLEDRFGKVPHEGEELMKVVMLRRKGKQLGCEKIVLKKGLMQLHLVENQESRYYQTAEFQKLLTFATQNVRSCQFKSFDGKPRMVIGNIGSVADALKLVTNILSL